MANLDLTTFTEVDSAADITVTSAKAAFDTMQRDAVSYVYDSFGVGYFTDFHFEFEVKIDSVSGDTGSVVLAAISDTVGTLQDMIIANDGIFFSAYANTGNLRFDLGCYSTDNVDSYTDGGTSSNILYCIFERVGTTTTVKIYSDSAHTTLVDNLSITSESGSKQYLYALVSRDSASNPSDSLTGYSQNFNIDVEFASQVDITSSISDPIFNRLWSIAADADIFFPISSSVFQERFFASTSNIVSNISDPVFNRAHYFASQADVVFDLTSDGNAQREFASQSDVVFDLTSDYKFQHTFKSQPIIGFNFGSSIFSLKYFTSTANVVFSINDPTWDQGGIFSVNTGITHNIRSNMNAVNEFISQANIVFDTSNPEIREERNFNSQGDIVLDIVSTFSGERKFIVYPTIPWDVISGGIEKSNIITSVPSVNHNIISDSNTERSFASTAGLVFDLSSAIQIEREFSSIAELIVFDFQRPKIFRLSQFISISSVDWNITTDANLEREFASTAGLVFDLSSAGGNAKREFGSSAGLVWNTVSDANAERNFLSQSDIVSSIIASIQREREFSVSSSIVWSVESLLRRFIIFDVAPIIDFVTNNLNIFKTNYFGSLPDITFNIPDPNIFISRQFVVESDIFWNIYDLTPIYVTRNFASTVNIIINVESLNIWNLSIDDLFPSSIRSLTPKRTANLI